MAKTMTTTMTPFKTIYKKKNNNKKHDKNA